MIKKKKYILKKLFFLDYCPNVIFLDFTKKI